MSKRLKIFWIAIAFPILYLSINIHSNTEPFNYRSEIYADKAGYYVYLPALFLYDFDVNKFPKELENKVGKGFSLSKINPKNGKPVVFTKYPYGVALLDVPFFFAAHAYCKWMDIPADGFSRPYFRMRTFTNWFYTFFGLGLLMYWLRKSFGFSESVIMWSIALFLLGTNLLYYCAKDVGLSHNYSLFAISLFMVYLSRYTAGFSWKNYMVLGLIAGLAVALRPINVLFIGLLLLWDIKHVGELKYRFLNHKAQWSVFLLCLGVLLIPQIAYYFYAFGSFLPYSYEEESFIYLSNPKIKEVLFGLGNGWLSNNPIHLLTLWGIGLMLFKKYTNSRIVLGLFLGITGLYASWWSWGLGCGYGHRGYVEFYAILIVPFAFGIQKIAQFRNQNARYAMVTLVALMVIYNLKLTFAYDGCWYGKTAFDVKEWYRLLFEIGFVK